MLTVSAADYAVPLVSWLAPVPSEQVDDCRSFSQSSPLVLLSPRLFCFDSQVCDRDP